MEEAACRLADEVHRHFDYTSAWPTNSGKNSRPQKTESVRRGADSPLSRDRSMFSDERLQCRNV